MKDFKEIYEIIKEIKENQEEYEEEREMVLKSLDEQYLKTEFISKMEELVFEEEITFKQKVEIKNILDKMVFTKHEESILNFDNDLKSDEENQALIVFDKIMNKLEMIETLQKEQKIKIHKSEIERMKNSSPMQPNIHTVNNPMEGVKSPTQSYIMGFFNYFSGKNVNWDN